MSNESPTTNTTTTDPTELLFEPVALVQLWTESAAALKATAEATQDEGEREVALAGMTAFRFCADQLAAWIRHEGQSTIMCMPYAFHRLMFAVHEFDNRDKESWKHLAYAADLFKGSTQ
jgi:hypothetical protein